MGKSCVAMTKFMVIGGKTGWIGQQLVQMLSDQDIEAVCCNTRMENRESLSAELDEVKPTHVINAAGVTGRPNVDWCEANKQATVRGNVIGMLNVADLCESKGIHHTCSPQAASSNTMKCIPWTPGSASRRTTRLTSLTRGTRRPKDIRSRCSRPSPQHLCCGSECRSQMTSTPATSSPKS